MLSTCRAEKWDRILDQGGTLFKIGDITECLDNDINDSIETEIEAIGWTGQSQGIYLSKYLLV